VEISVLFTGYQKQKAIYHLLPPRPPLTLDAMFPCTTEEICSFSGNGNFGYFRHILRQADLPVSELLAAHIQQAAVAQRDCGEQGWIRRAAQELIIMLRDDYATLIAVLSALSDTGLDFSEQAFANSRR